MLDGIFIFETCMYDFFIIKDFGAFFIMDSMFLLDGGATGGFVVKGGETTVDCEVKVEFEIVNFPFEFSRLGIKLDDFDS